MAIPLTDVAWQHRQVRADIDLAIDRILTDVHADGAELIAALEATMARRLGEAVHAIAVQSGLAAEFLLLKGLGIGPGDEVITVPNSDIATTAAISHTGARFVLVDVDARTHNLDPNLIEAAITPRTRAIVPVHMYGLPAAMDEINDVAPSAWVARRSRTPRWRSARCIAGRRWDRSAMPPFSPSRRARCWAGRDEAVWRRPEMRVSPHACAC